MNKLIQRIFCIVILLLTFQMSVLAQGTISSVIMTSPTAVYLGLNTDITVSITVTRPQNDDGSYADGSIEVQLVANNGPGTGEQNPGGSVFITNDDYDGGTAVVNGYFNFTANLLTGNTQIDYIYAPNSDGVWATDDEGNIITGFVTGIVTAPPGNPPKVSAGTATGSVGVPFSYAIQATNTPTLYGMGTNPTPPGGGNPAPPAGLSVNTSTGVISGTPTTVGVYYPEITANNIAGFGVATLAITITPAPPVITSAHSINATDSYPFNYYSVTATNTPTSYGATNLPSGLTINSTTGAISGTPTVFGTFNATISASNPGGTGSQSLVVTVSPPWPAFGVLPSCITNSATSVNINVTNYPGPGLGTYTLQYIGYGPNFLSTGTIPVVSYSGSNCVLALNIPSPLTTNVLGNYYLTYTSTAGLASDPSLLVIGSTIPPVIVATANGSSNTVYNTTNTAYLNGHDCIPLAGGTPTDFTLAIAAPETGFIYSWSYGTVDGTNSNGWTSVGQSGATPPYTNTGTTLTIPSASFNNQIGIIVLTVTDACGHVTPYTYTINRYLPATISPNLSSLISFNTTCTTAGSPIIASLATTGSIQANSNPVTWTLPPGWTYTNSGNGITTIIPSATATPGSYTLYAVVGNGADGAACNDNGSTLSYVINIEPSVVPSISGNSTCLISGGSNILTASPNICSTCNYTWSATAGMLGTPSGNTDNFVSTGQVASITATYNVAPGCAVTSTPIVTTTASPIVDKGTYCITGSSVNITVTNYPGTGSYVLEYFNVGQSGYSDFLVHNTFTPNSEGVINILVNEAVATPTSTGCYKLTYVSTTCGTGSFTTFVVGTTPTPINITGTTTCLSTYTGTTLTASQVLCATCTYTWAASAGTLSGQTGSTIAYVTSGQLATITATYNVEAGCSISSAPITMIPSVPIVTLPSCVGNAPNATEYLTVDNYSPASNYNYAFKYMNIGAPGYTDFLKESTSVTPTLSSGGTWVVPLQANPTNYNNESMGIYQLINNSCPGSPETTPLTFGAAPPFTVSFTAATKTLLANPTYAPYTWYNLNTGVDLASSSYYTLTSPSSGANDYFSAQTTINGCTYSSSYLVPNYIARPTIDNENAQDISTQSTLIGVYPNPNQGEFTINIQQVNDKASANLYDNNGKLIREISLVQGTNQVNATGLANGEYNLIIWIDGNSYPNKIIITK